MSEIPVNKQIMRPRLDVIAQEYDSQREYNNPFRLMNNVFDGYKNGPVVLALGAVGGNGASTKAEGILEQFAIDRVPFKVAAMRKYIESNPLVAEYLKQKGIQTTLIEDGEGMNQLYKDTETAISKIAQKQPISGILSLGPRTYYPEAARRLGVKAMMIDGAVPDKWEDSIDSQTGYPNTAYAEKAYRYTTYATTCGFTGWTPPIGSYPEGMDLKVVQQPFSDNKNKFMSSIRKMFPKQAREVLLQRNTISGLDADSLIVVPTMDQVYLNPQALVANGGFMTPDQFGQAYAFMAETIVTAAEIGKQLGKKTAIYLRPGVIQNTMSEVIKQFGKDLTILSPQNEIVSNVDWLLLRKAGVTIGRAPLCVSTAEALGMDDYQITAAVPGVTSDGTSYMTENEGLQVLNRKGVSRVIFPGNPLLPAMEEVMKVKGL